MNPQDRIDHITGDDKKYILLYNDFVELAPYASTKVDYNTKIKLYRIKALRDFNDIKKGDKGGFIQSYANLSQEGNSWIYNPSFVFLDARVIENAIIKWGWIRDNVIVKGNSIIKDDCYLMGDSIIDENGIVDVNKYRE